MRVTIVKALFVSAAMDPSVSADVSMGFDNYSRVFNPAEHVEIEKGARHLRGFARLIEKGEKGIGE